MNTGYNPMDTARRQINYRFLLICFVIGAATGTTGDLVHVITHTDQYPHDGPFPFLPLLPVEIPVWVPFLFGGAMVLIGIVHKILGSTFTPRMAYSREASTIAPLGFLLMYALSGIIHAGTGGWQDVWMVIVALFFWWTFDRTIVGAALAILTAVGGTVFEIFLVSINGFSYYPQHSNLLGVPSWLPWLYFVASITVSLVVRWI